MHETSRPFTILMVEDSADARRMMRMLLSRLGVRVIEAYDGFAGVESARHELPDLILMDLGLPVVDGWEATRRLKADPATQHIPVVIVTAHALSDETRRVQEVGCEGYVTKPIEPTAFLAFLRQFLPEAACKP